MIKDKYARREIRRVARLRKFPENTCPASRHTQMIGERLALAMPYPMLTDEPEHCATSMLSTVGSLYDVRTKLAEAYRFIAANAQRLPRSRVRTKAVNYEKECRELNRKLGLPSVAIKPSR